MFIATQIRRKKLRVICIQQFHRRKKRGKILWIFVYPWTLLPPLLLLLALNVKILRETTNAAQFIFSLYLIFLAYYLLFLFYYIFLPIHTQQRWIKCVTDALRCSTSPSICFSLSRTQHFGRDRSRHKYCFSGAKTDCRLLWSPKPHIISIWNRMRCTHITLLACTWFNDLFFAINICLFLPFFTLFVVSIFMPARSACVSCTSIEHMCDHFFYFSFFVCFTHSCS